jgi:hypothetical protein
MLTEWVGRKYAEVADRAEGLGDLGADDSGPGALAGVLLLDQGQFETALEQTGEVVDRAIELFQLDDPVEARMELEMLGREIARGDHGALAMLIAPNLGGAYERLVESRDRIATRRTQLMAIAEGLVAPEDLANAALWYLEAIELIRGLSPEGLRALRRPDSVDPDREPGAMHLLTLENAAAAIDLLETGSRLGRCDFSIARSGPTVIPRYLPPLCDATRLLLLDALRLMLEDEPQQAADRLAVAFRMSAHLAGDGLPVSSLLSHTVFAWTSSFMRGAQGRGLLTEAQHPTLREAVVRTSRLDPFGHVAARIEARDAASAWLRRTVGAEAALDELVRRAHELDGDHLLLVLLVRGGASDASVDAGPLDDVIAVEAIKAVRQWAEAIRERLASGDLTVLDEPVDPIARIEKAIDVARFELPRALEALEDR